MSSRPRIGISLDTDTPDEYRKVYSLNSQYANAIIHAGGLPIILPHTSDQSLRREMIASLHGLLIPGGADIHPALWNEPLHPKTYLMDSDRQNFDLALLGLADNLQLPTLGICLGCQLMNVLRGGSLYQSITDVFPESTIRHCSIKDPQNYNSSFHDVTLRPGTHLSSIYLTDPPPDIHNDTIPTNSRHRQAVHDVGADLVVSAFAPDGIIEAIEDFRYPFWIGVQWHPENLADTIHERLFRHLVDAARAFQSRHSEI